VCRNADDSRARRYILCNDGAGADAGIRADGYPGQHRGAGADPGANANHDAAGETGARHDVDAITEAALVIDDGTGIDETLTPKLRFLAD
jgi:hypothetical protein